MIQKTSFPATQTSALALQAAIASQAKNPTGLHAGLHALYKVLRHEPELQKKFIDSFLPQILKELDLHAVNGSLASLTRHQMLMVLYGEIPQVRLHYEMFVKKLEIAGYPWIKQVMRRIESGIALGLQTGQQQHLVRTCRDLQQYVSVTSKFGPFKALQVQTQHKIVAHYHKLLLDQDNCEKFIIYKEQMNRLIRAFDAQGVLDHGLQELNTKIAQAQHLKEWVALSEDYETLRQLEGQKTELLEAQKGVESARRALEHFQERPLSPELKGAIERKQMNVAGVVEWYEQWTRLNNILTYASQGGLSALIEEVCQKIEPLQRRCEHYLSKKRGR